MEPSQTILDIGVGRYPWLVANCIRPHSSPLSKLYSGVPTNTKYICIDRREEALKHSEETFEEYKKVVLGKTELILMDGSNLSFEDNKFDAVIVSDVLSMPPEEWCSCDDNPDCTGCDDGTVYKGCPEDMKDKIIAEAMRVLKPGGKLIVTVYQTARYAYRVLDDLKKIPTLSEIKNLSAGEYNTETFDIYWQEQVFLKSC